MPLWINRDSASLDGWLAGGGIDYSLTRTYEHLLTDDTHDPNNPAHWEETLSLSGGSPALNSLTTGTALPIPTVFIPTQGVNLTLRLNPLRFYRLDRLTGTSAGLGDGKIIMKASDLSMYESSGEWKWLETADTPGGSGYDRYVLSLDKWWGFRWVQQTPAYETSSSMGLALAGVVVEDDALGLKILETRNAGVTVSNDTYVSADASYLYKAYVDQRNTCGLFELFLTPPNLTLAPDTDSILSSLRAYMPVSSVTSWLWLDANDWKEPADGGYRDYGEWVPFGLCVNKTWQWESISVRTGYAACDESIATYTRGLQYHEVGA